MINPKRVLIVIVIYNGADYLRDCLTSLSKITYERGRYEFFLVDNGSTDGSVDYVKNNWGALKLLENQKNYGFAHANNMGLQYAVDYAFDYVYLLNQDTIVEPDFLEKAVAVADSDHKIGAVQSKLLLHPDKDKINSIGNETHYLGFGFAGGYRKPDSEMESKEITYPSGASVLLRVYSLKKVGFFNPDFFAYHEDSDLGWRLRLADYKIMLAPESIVYHKYQFSRSIKKFYLMERNRYLIILQNYKLPTLILITPACLLMSVAMFFYSFFSGWWWELLKVYGYFLNPINWIKISKARTKAQKIREVSDKKITKRFVGTIDFQDVQNPLLKYVANPIFNLYWQIIRKIIFW
ncbi:MAG: hypothetical protein CMI53_03210 [Parcubacteria group bacterium]|nr:hypothetical protein [Parcubacteria group bacterium]